MVSPLALSRELDTPAGDPVRAKWSRRGRPRMGPIWKLVDHPSTIASAGRGEIPLFGPVAQWFEQRTDHPSVPGSNPGRPSLNTPANRHLRQEAAKNVSRMSPEIRRKISRKPASWHGSSGSVPTRQEQNPRMERRVPPTEQKTIAAQVPLDVARALKAKAQAGDRSVSAEIRRALIAHLQERPQTDRAA